MEVVVHDIVYLKSMDQLDFFEPFQDWMQQDEMAQGIAVVRRMKVIDGKVAIGFRGNHRSKRFAAITSMSNIQRVIRPFDIIHNIVPVTHKQTLQTIEKVLAGHKWGIGGSVGFSMATGINVCHEQSDVDIIIYCNKISEMDQFSQLPSQLGSCTHLVDIQVEIIGIGAVVLTDYLHHSSFILRTGTGPILLEKATLNVAR